MLLFFCSQAESVKIIAIGINKECHAATVGNVDILDIVDIVDIVDIIT